MLEPPLPAEEQHRLHVLLGLNLLDTAPEERFDRITRMAARLFGVPIALVGLVDAERQWFKSRVGLPEQELPRQATFCAHAILQDAILVIEDALADARFAGNPFVASGRVRFYAGVAVAAPDGSKVGTLCLIDSAPRSFDEEERTLLGDLAAIVAHELAADALRRALQQQRDSEAWLRALLDNLPEGVLVLDETAAVLSANAAAGVLFGASAQALAGRGAQSFAVEDITALLAGLPDGEVRTRQLTGRRVDGASFPLEVTVNAMTLGGRRRYGAIVRDVALRLEQSWRMRAAGERRHKTFTLAAHELRTPLASIIGFSELLVKRDFDAPTARELLGIINTQAGAMATVINQVFDLARVEAGGRRALQIRAEPLGDILVQALGSIAPLGQNARIVLALDPGLPPVAADCHRMSMALANVLTNSLAYSGPGTVVTVRAWVAQAPAAPAVLVQVADSGPGMDPDEQERLFEAFHRGPNAGAIPGHGLGMAIFKEIVDAHNAGVDVASAPGSGTTITVHLPIAGEAADG